MSAEVMTQFNKAASRPYVKQAIFFLNAFWVEHGKEAEKIWDYTHAMIAMDTEKKDLGCYLDEFSAHKFLEKFGETMTAIELRNKLRQVDINNDKKMALLEYLLNRYDEKVEVMMERPQDTNDELEKAKLALEQVIAEIGKIEAHKLDLENIAAGGGVKGNAAKQELFKLLNEDPLELNKMVISAEAAVRKAKKMENNVCMGAVWWLERELDEAKRYKPKGTLKLL
jgi:hypothetical protein